MLPTSTIRTATAILFFTLTVSTNARAYEQEIEQLSREIAGKISTSSKQKIAVVDFTDLQGEVTALGRFLAEEFSVRLANTGDSFHLIDRTHLASIIREHKLSKTGIIEPSTARKLGQITGAEALLTGSITPFGDSVRVTAKILDVDSATIVASASGNIPKTEAIRELLNLEIGERRHKTGPNQQPGQKATLPNTQFSAAQTLVVNEYTFALRECRQISGAISCKFIITNKGQDRDLQLFRGSRFFDEMGNELEATGAQLGKRKVSFRHYSSARNHLISGIPVKAEMSFPGMVEGATVMKVLEIKCESFKLHFKNVKVLQ